MNGPSRVYDFLTSLSSIGIFTRIFSWKRIIQEASSVLQELDSSLRADSESLRNAELRISALMEQKEELKNMSLGREEADARRYQDMVNQNARISEDLACARELLATETAEKQACLSKISEIRVARDTIERESAVAIADLSDKYEKLSQDYQSVRESLSIESEGKRNEALKYQSLKEEYESLVAEAISLKEKLSAEESVKELRSLEYDHKVEKLNTLIEQMEADHRLAAEKIRESYEERNRELSTAWQQHEQLVEDTLKNYAKRYDFIRCEKEEYPYKGTPDNVFFIGGMYTVFDAKSPKNPEELESFPAYLKKQAEAMSKYCKNENVRKDAFLVVPVSTLGALDTFVYPLADYTVYVITLEAVLPILHMLRTLEGYEFAEQLSPEDRDKLCRFIGKLSHTTKRKVQIDTYFSHELVGVLREIDLLPDDFVHNITQYEQKAKLNPPQEKRSKIIAVSDISEDVEKLESEILGWSIVRE